MSMPTSEQAITAIEHSSKPTLELLDDAAAIIGLSLSETINGHDTRTASPLAIDTAKFREQWLLRWIIKKLGQVIDVKQTSDEDRGQLLADYRTWKLLSALLSSIPRHASKAILIERNFCHTFSECLAICTSLRPQKRPADDQLPPRPFDPDNYRLFKKRKISQDQSAPEYGQIPYRHRLLVSVLHIASQIAQTLSALDEVNVSRQRSVSSNWAKDVDEAAMFIARLISATTILTTEYSRGVRLEDGTHLDFPGSLERWIDLWQASATAAQNQQKQTPSLAFVNHALLPALDFLGVAARGSRSSVSRALERQVATSCVLPMRAVFRKQCASTWDSAGIWGVEDTEPEWTKIQKFMETLTNNLGEAAASFGTSRGERRMATLLSIASRVVPASDVIRRRADRSWIEALFLCLCLSLNTSASEPELNSDLNRPLNVVSANHPLPLPIYTSSVCLDALQDANIEPSTNFWQFYVRYTLSGGETKLSAAALAKMVGLNKSVFVPEKDGSTPTLLETFYKALREVRQFDEQSLQQALENILAPIWEEFGKRRRLDVLVKFWEAKLLETFHTRSTPAAENSSDVLWDHPDLLDAFSLVCQQHAPLSLCSNMLNIITKDIARLADIVGPTHEIFARITILGPMLRSINESSSIRKLFNDRDEALPHLIQKALLRKTDYQGHRWRLWKILEKFVQTFSITLKTTDLTSLELPWMHLPFATPDDFDSRLVHLRSRLMELFQSFSCVVGIYEIDDTDSTSIFARLLTALCELMQTYKSHIEESERMLQSWNGLSEDMDTVFKLLSACLARIARCSRTWCSSGIVPDKFLKILAAFSFGAKDSDGLTELAIAAEATLAETAVSARVNLLDTFTGAVSKDAKTRFAPLSLHSAAQGRATEHQVHELCKVLLGVMDDISVYSHHETFVQYLSLITETMIKHPGPMISALDLNSYTHFLRGATFDATPELLAVAYQLIQRLTQQLFEQAASLSDGETSAIREELLRWTKKHFNEIEASEEVEVLDKYTGYLVLAVAQLAHRDDSKHVSKKERKSIESIKETHANVVIRNCRKLVEEQDDTINFWSILVLLDSLPSPQDDKSIDKKLQKCLQKVAQAIVAAGDDISDNITMPQQTRTVAKLWDVLSRHKKSSEAQHIPDFPHTSFVQSLDQQDTRDALVLQAQLATKYSSRESLVSLARNLRLSITEAQHEGQEANSNKVSNPYLSVAAKICSLKLDDTSADIETVEVLGHIACLQTAIDETSLASLVVRLELSQMVLDKHSAIVNQHVIDSTLTSIVTLASSGSKTMVTSGSTDIKPEYVFDRLCSILSTLLVRYRRRLTGRHHILLPALQNLLKCLFYPAARKNTSTLSVSRYTYLASLPPWLNSSTHTNTLTLPAQSATKFSRLLQQLCDPSASSARHVSKRVRGTTNANDNLTDDVKTLRREVSRHTQYLLQTYCQVMLDGYISPEVKEKLLPGLYAAMSAMDVEVMRALNAAMDASQRAIWKDLYTDWKKFGRWNQR